MDALKDSQLCPRAALGALVDLATAAFAAHGRHTGAVDLDDLEQLVGALHRLRPGFAQFAYFDGWLRMLCGDWDEAIAVFRDLVDRSLCLPSSQGLLLKCLQARGEFGWQDEARRLAEEHKGGEIGCLARALIASDDLQQAQREAARTGKFVAPASVLELEESQARGGDARGAPGLPAFEPSLAMQYLRI